MADSRENIKAKIMEKMAKGRLTRAEAIRCKCIECCAWNTAEVRRCKCENCPLWRYRMGREARATES